MNENAKFDITLSDRLNSSCIFQRNNATVNDMANALTTILWDTMNEFYPIKKKVENNNEVRNEEDLVQSLIKLIMGRFDDKKNEFYEWSQTIHDEVGFVMDIFFC